MSNDVCVIFLDIDGVLLPFGDDVILQDDHFPNPCLKSLNSLIESVGLSSCYLVLSSTWRMDIHSINYIYQEFNRYGSLLGEIKEFASMTNKSLHSTRYEEICDWLNNHKPIDIQMKSWVVLDDDEESCITTQTKKDNEFNEKCVIVNSKTGMTMEDTRKAITILS